jgi:hypothetical protein
LHAGQHTKLERAGGERAALIAVAESRMRRRLRGAIAFAR